MSVRRPNDYLQGPFEKLFAHGSINSDTTLAVFKFNRQCRIKRVSYINPTGLTDDAANFVDIQVKNGATVVANWSTETGEEGALTANTSVDMTLSGTDTDLVFEAGDTLTLFVDASGTVTLPAGHVNLEGVYF